MMRSNNQQRDPGASDGVESREMRSWEDLRARVEEILEGLHDDPRLGVAAAANPILALDELGYRIAPEARQTIEDRFRFPRRTAARLRALRRELITIAGWPLDPDSETEVRSLLFDELGLNPHPGEKSRTGRPAALPDTAPRPVQVRWAPVVPDSLEPLRGAHPILVPLLEYRRLEASAPRLAPRELYRELREGRRAVPITRLRGHLKGRGESRAGAADA